jgi:type IV pilus assembly protein PilV
MKRRSPKQERGATLLEALVAILIFSSALLALLGLQAFSVMNAADAKYRSDASFLADEIIGQMWVDKDNLASYGTGNDNKTAWLAQIAGILPQGDGTIAVDGDAVTVTVSWQLPDQDTPHNHVTVTTIAHNE